MISVLAGGMLFICCAYTGMGVRRYYRSRKLFFADFFGFLNLLENEISYHKAPLKHIIKIFCEDKRGVFVDFLTVFEGRLEKGEVFNQSAVGEILKASFLKGTEKEVVISFFSGLGKIDYTTQLLNIKQCKLKVENHLNQCTIEFKKNGNLAYKLGILLGIATMIMVA